MRAGPWETRRWPAGARKTGPPAGNWASGWCISPGPKPCTGRMSQAIRSIRLRRRSLGRSGRMTRRSTVASWWICGWLVPRGRRFMLPWHWAGMWTTARCAKPLKPCTGRSHTTETFRTRTRGGVLPPGLDPPDGEKRLIWLSARDVRSWAQAAACYRSQVSTFWNTEHELEAELARVLRLDGGQTLIGPVERLGSSTEAGEVPD